jgi:hypothetical protein
MGIKYSDERMEWEDWAVVVTVLLFMFAVGLFALSGGSASTDYPGTGHQDSDRP